jgi:hypothetical protein
MLLPFFEWMGTLWASTPFHDSVWSTPILGSVHLLALVTFAGAVLVVDLRLLGRGLTNTPISQLSRTAEPWLMGSFLVLVVSGLPQIATTPLKAYHSPFFWLKMQAVLIGVMLTLTVRRRMSMRTDAELGPVWPKVVALLSLALWTSAMIGARWIGLMG